ncbi:MAG: Mrp/NBP35 family ATP-binding protein [Rhodothermales bacterium]|nr:Mrp/NBP35 family ATP-binding protein [Rhodothermales bacterium]MBO6781378.1 Mrp/NBP35 family ATP-binding protein [Rhodothermales bacterium]
MLDRVLDALETVIEPDSGEHVLRRGMVRDLDVDDASVSLTLVLDDPGSAFAATAQREVEHALRAALADGVQIGVAVDNPVIGFGDDLQVDGKKELLPGVRHTLAVASGKGGVGKSTVTVNLAVALARQGYRVGLVDTDIYGPSMPVMLGLETAKPRVNEQRRILPIETRGIKVLSMGFLVDPDKAVIWRGPMVSSAIRQFLGEAEWGDLDFLLMDLPPGTGDIQLTIVQTVPLAGAVIVSTPQKVALADARKGVAMFRQVDVPVVGMVENMAWFEPPDAPGKRYFLFGENGAAELAQEEGVPLLGQIPLQQPLREACDSGEPAAAGDGPIAAQFDALARNTARSVFRRAATLPASKKIEILYK